jgi:hypothetical protein
VVVVLTVASIWSVKEGPPDTKTGPAHAYPTFSLFRPYLRTASRFVGALSSFHLHQARELLAPAATFTGAVDTESWARVMRFFHETGGQIVPGQCHQLGRGRVPEEITVSCPYRYQLLRSGDLGLGPYGGSHFQITFGPRRITHVTMEHETDTNGFSTQMWTPFAIWVHTFHHADGAKMYPDWPQAHHWPATNQAIRLWSQRTRQFVQYARHLCSTPRGDFAALCSARRRALAGNVMSLLLR